VVITQTAALGAIDRSTRRHLSACGSPLVIVPLCPKAIQAQSSFVQIKGRPRRALLPLLFTKPQTPDPERAAYFSEIIRGSLLKATSVTSVISMEELMCRAQMLMQVNWCLVLTTLWDLVQAPIERRRGRAYATSAMSRNAAPYDVA
jgi:hypothetical protein